MSEFDYNPTPKDLGHNFRPLRMTPEERATDVLDDAANRIMQPDEHRLHRAISEAVRAAVAEEREACVMQIPEARAIASAYYDNDPHWDLDDARVRWAMKGAERIREILAAAIRARTS